MTLALFQPIAWAAPSVDGWQPVLLPGAEGKTLGVGPSIGNGPSAGWATLLAIPNMTHSGALIPNYGSDLYERIHISTILIALGNVIGLQQRTVSVWNAYTRSQVLFDINENNAEGITLSQRLQSSVYLFGALEEVSYVVTVDTSGPPTIDASYTWDFEPYDLTLRITGSRVTAWSFAPDWSRPVTERMSWLSDVIQSFDGNEQRGTVRLGPRKSWEFEVFFDGQARRYAESAMWGWGARAWALPAWPDGLPLRDNLPAGATEIAIDTATRDYAAGSLAMILRDAFTYEVLEVQSVSAGLLSLKRPTTREWRGSDMIYPTRVARLSDSLDLPRWDGRACMARVQFDVQQPVDHQGADDLPIYRSRPVLTTRPNWQGGFDLELSRKLAEIDSITGGRSYDDEADIPLPRQRMRWLLATRADQEAYRRLLYTLRGRVGSIWIPSWTADFVIVAQIVDNMAAMDVEWCGYTKYVAQSVSRRDVRIELVDGTVFYRRILGSQELDGAVERLVIDSPLGRTLQPDQVALVSYLTLCRLNADDVEIAHWTGETSESVTVFQGYRNEL